jgi:hypothetical protein
MAAPQDRPEGHADGVASPYAPECVEGAFPEVGTPEKRTGLFRPPSPNGLARCLQEARRILTGLYVTRIIVDDGGARARI